MVHHSSGNAGYDTQRCCDGCHCASGSSLLGVSPPNNESSYLSNSFSFIYIFSFTCMGCRSLFLFVVGIGYTDPLLLFIFSAVNEQDVISVLALYPFTTWSVHLQRKQQQQQQQKLHAVLLFLIQSVVTIQRLERDIYR